MKRGMMMSSILKYHATKNKCIDVWKLDSLFKDPLNPYPINIASQTIHIPNANGLFILNTETKEATEHYGWDYASRSIRIL